MPFMIFIVSIFALAYYHRLEHRQLIASLRALQLRLATETPDRAVLEQQLAGEDWRIIGLRGMRLQLRRKFMVQDKQSLLRYGVPVVILCAILVLLQNFILAALYAAGLAVKWFLSVTELSLDPHHPEFEVTVLGHKIFLENLKAAAAKPEAADEEAPRQTTEF